MLQQTGFPSIDKPWLKYYPEEIINAALPQESIYSYLKTHNQSFPDDIAIEYFNKKITYQTLFDRVQAVERSLCALGVKENDIVTVALPSIPEAMYCVYALNKIGAIANMIHPLAGTTETVRYLNEASSRVAILYSGTYSLVKNELPHTSVKKAIVVSAAEDLSMLYRLLIKKKENCKIEDGALSWQQFINCGQKYTGPISARTRTTDTTSIMSHTGGTTGVPKAVMLSDNNINAEIFQIGCNLKHCRGEKMLVCLPPFVNYSLTNSMLEPLALGITIVMIPQFDPTKFVDYLKQYRFQHINSIPDYWQALLKIKKIHKADFSCLQHLYYGGEAMNINEENEVNDLLLAGGAKRKLAKGYGSTEMTSAVTATYEACNTEGSLGIPLVKTIGKIVRPGTNEELPYCEEGEICIAGPTVMLGYYNNPQETE